MAATGGGQQQDERGDPLLLERLVGNLVANAIKYNEPGGWVEVEVASESGPALTVRSTAHGGAVRAQLRPGGGLIVEIDLPLASSAAGR
jgi:hypothetical protein